MKARFLLFVLLAAIAPLVPAMLITGEVALKVEEGLEDRVSAASQALMARLEADAARRREMLLRLSALPVLAAGVEEAAAAGAAPTAESVAGVRGALGELFPREIPELVAVVTVAGAQVVITTGEPRAVAPAELPFAAVALGGQFAEGIAAFDGATYRFSAVPVGIADGALVIAERLGNPTTTKLSDVARALVSFVSGQTVLASSLPPERRPAVLEASQRTGTVVGSGLLPIGLPALESLQGTFPLLVRRDAFRSLSRDIGGGVSAIVTVPAERELGWLARLQLLCLALSLGTLGFGLLWAGVVDGPLRRQARSVEAHLARLRVEKTARLGARGFSGPFLPLVAELDRLAEEWGRDGSARPARESSPGPASKEATPEVRRPSADLAPAPEAGASDEAEGTPSAFPFGDDTRAAAARLGLDPAMGRTKTPPAFPAPNTEPRPKVQELARTGTDDFSGPIPLPSGPGGPKPKLPEKKGDPFASFGPTPAAGDDDRTREAVIPEELLARSRELEAELMEAPDDPDEAHFKTIFAEFTDTKKHCGEPPDGLTYDKFVGRLKKNREQLVAKYNCRSVRFQVYVKDGKAAIKAAPVR